MRSTFGFSLSIVVAVTVLALSGCSGMQSKASYPTRPDGSPDIIYSDQKRETIWGDGKSLSDVFTGSDEDPQDKAAGIGVNGFLWRAALDTISFMPVQSADPFGGVILTDWYSPEQTPDERFKMNIYILDKQLRADGVRVSVFKQRKDGKGQWQDAAVEAKTGTDVENTILTRARELKVAQQAISKK